MEQTLADKQFATELLALRRDSATGILRVRAEGTCSEAHVRDGIVTFVAGGLPSDSIGRELVRRGMLSVADYQRVVERRMAIQGRRKFGDVALELEVIDRETLTRVLQEQVRHKLGRCFHWDRAHIEFEKTVDVMPVPLGGGVKVESILLPAARQHYGPGRVRARLGDAWDAPLGFADSVDLAPLGLGPADQTRVQRLLAAGTPSQLVPSPEADRSMATLVIALWLFGAVELSGVQQPEAVEEEEEFEVGLGGKFGLRNSRDRLLADGAFLQGKELFVQGEYAAAADAFEQACGLRPRAREYALAAAWAKYLAEGGDEASHPELQAMCDAALAQDRHLGLAYHVRANLALQRGDTARAREELNLAVAFDPNDEVSVEMLRKLEG